MNRIKCSVATCKYNDNAEACQADQIMVKNNFGSTDTMEFGTVGSEVNARTTMETCCETFAPKKEK